MNAVAHDFVTEDAPISAPEEEHTTWLERQSVERKVRSAVLGSIFFLWLACR